MRLLVAAIITAATFCFGLGITQPLIEVERFLLFAEKPSLIGIVAGLWSEDDWLLAILIALFSIALPAAKLVAIQYFYIAHSGAATRLPTLLGNVSRWSMLDVLLVALVIFAAKTSGLATALTLPGLWFFTAAVVLTALASLMLGAERKRNSQG